MRLILVFACGLVGCASPWGAVLDAMHRNTVRIEINREDEDFNAIVPVGMAPARDNRWLLFFYDPVVETSLNRAFVRLDDDCFLHTRDEDGDHEHVAICAFERVPPAPPAP